jgi:hypothetical protein
MADAPLPQHGNATTHNLETVLQTNIENSMYYKGLFAHEFTELVDEIYNEVRAFACACVRARMRARRACSRCACAQCGGAASSGARACACVAGCAWARTPLAAGARARRVRVPACPTLGHS